MPLYPRHAARVGLVWLVCGQTAQAQPSIDSQTTPVREFKGSGPVVETLPFTLDQVTEAASQVLVDYRCRIRESRTGYLRCARDKNAHPGGGERIVIRLEERQAATHIVIETARERYQVSWGQRNWSRRVFDSVVEELAARRLPATAMPESVRWAAIEPGQRVRVTTRGSLRMVGSVVAANERGLTIADVAKEPMFVRNEIIANLELSVRRRSHWKLALVTGAAVGAIVGSLQGPSCYGGLVSRPRCYSRTGTIVIDSVEWGLASAVLGAAIRTDEWAVHAKAPRIVVRPELSSQTGRIEVVFGF